MKDNDDDEKMHILIGHKSRIRTTVNEIIFYVSTEISDIFHCMRRFLALSLSGSRSITHNRLLRLIKK